MNRSFDHDPHTRLRHIRRRPQPASPEPQRLPSVEVDLDKNTAKSPGSAVLCRAGRCVHARRCESREVGSSPKLCRTFYRRRTEVLGMDFTEAGAELGRCGVRLGVNLIRILQNRPEVANSYQDRAREDGRSAEVGRQGHPPNFVGSSIEGEHKFGGWIRQRWVPSLADAGIVGRANVLRECKIGWKCDPSVRIGRERVATVQKSRGGSSPKLCQTF